MNIIVTYKGSFYTIVIGYFRDGEEVFYGRSDGPEDTHREVARNANHGIAGEVVDKALFQAVVGLEKEGIPKKEKCNDKCLENDDNQRTSGGTDDIT